MRAMAKAGLAFAVALGALAGGCHHRRDVVHDARRIAQFERNLVALAARDTGCATVQVQPVRIGDQAWVANTCVGPREYFLDCRSRRSRWASCRWQRVATVGESTTGVLGCPPPSIEQELGPAPTTRFASGCGRRVQVSLRCNELGCGWVPDGAPSGAPPPGYGAPAPRILVIPAR